MSAEDAKGLEDMAGLAILKTLAAFRFPSPDNPTPRYLSDKSKTLTSSTSPSPSNPPSFPHYHYPPFLYPSNSAIAEPAFTQVVRDSIHKHVKTTLGRETVEDIGIDRICDKNPKFAEELENLLSKK